MTKELRDVSESALRVISESRAGKGGPMIVGGRFQHADLTNANGRQYSSALWERVLNDEGVMNMIKRRQMLGTVEHPDNGETRLNNVSHIITKLERRGDEIYGEAELLDTPDGRIMQELARKGVPIGVSSRGKGKAVYENGVEKVEDDSFILETFDLVYKPSTPGAYTEVCESVMSSSPVKKDSSDEEVVSFIESSQHTVSKLRDNTAFGNRSNLEEAQRELLALTESAKLVGEGKADNLVKDAETLLEQVNAAIKDKDLAEAMDTKIAKILEEKKIVDMEEALEESQAFRRQVQSRLDEANEQLAELPELTRRCEAATSLAEETLEKLNEALSSLAELKTENECLNERYQAAVELAAQLSDQLEEDAAPTQEEKKFPESINLEHLRTEEEDLDDCNESVENTTRGIDASVLKFNVIDQAQDVNESITGAEISRMNESRASGSSILESGSETNSTETDFLKDLLESTGGQ